METHAQRRPERLGRVAALFLIKHQEQGFPYIKQ